MNLSKSKIFLLFSFIAVLVYSCKIPKTIVGSYSTKYEDKFIQISRNNKFNYKYSEVKDTISGDWSWSKGNLILATKLQPNNYAMYKVSESFLPNIHKDSILIIYRPRDGLYWDPNYQDSVFTFPLRYTEVNGIPFVTPLNGRLQIKKIGKLKKLKTHGSMTDYPVYYFKSQDVNFITIDIALIPREGEYFQYGSYIENEVFFYKNDFIINLEKGEVYYKRN